MKKIVAVLMAMLMVMSVTVALAGGVAAKDTEPKVPVIIGFKDKPSQADKGMIRGHGGDIKHSYTIINAIAAKLPEQAIDKIKKNSRVAYVEMDGKVHALGAELDNSWGVKRIGAGVVHGYNKGTGVKVAIIDTGIDYTHPDLDANYKEGGLDYVNGDSDPRDDNGHGTHCAGIVAAEDNEEGVVGVAPEAHLYAVKVLDSGGSGYLSDVIAGIQWSMNNGMQVISMSLGTDTDYQSLHNACDEAYAAGIVVVAAAGNDYLRRGRAEYDTVDYPARYDSVIAVGATDSNDEKASWSSTGPDLELAAPGVEILSTYSSGYAYMSGTSMACPHVAGTAALVMVSEPTFTNVDVRQRLQATADDLGDSGWDTWYGYGLGDADEAAPPPAVPNTPPVADADGPYAGTEDVAITFDGSGSYDPDGDPLTYAWDFGDGTTRTGVTTAHAYETAGRYTVVLTVTDNGGLTDKDTAIVTVTEAPTYPTMHVASIDMWYKTAGRNYKIYTKVLIVDADNVTVEGATVYLNMTLPTGSTASGSGDTGTDGTVTFVYGPTKSTETYTSEVTSVKKNDWSYISLANEETSDSITVP